MLPNITVLLQQPYGLRYNLTMSKSKFPRRVRKTYKLTNFNLIGYCQTNTFPGEQAQVLTKAMAISDHPDFHHYVRGFVNEIHARLKDDGIDAPIDSASSFAVVIDKDKSAKLYIDNFGMEMLTVVKRSVEKDDPVYMNDIGDIRVVKFPELRLKTEHRLIVCFRYGWKFVLYFDLTPDGALDIDELQAATAAVMRRLMFEKLYESMDDDAAFRALLSKGWFPFTELIGGEFEELQKGVLSDFNVAVLENDLIGKFTTDRLKNMTERWWKAPVFASRRPLLEEGVTAFGQGHYIACIKTLISEIEGIFRERHQPKTAGRQGIDLVLREALEEVEKQIGGSDTLFFPAQFLTYLKDSFYGHFDPDMPADTATRNSVVHGRATPDAYTPIRALQTILVLDQINRYVLPPSAPSTPA